MPLVECSAPLSWDFLIRGGKRGRSHKCSFYLALSQTSNFLRHWAVKKPGEFPFSFSKPPWCGAGGLFRVKWHFPQGNILTTCQMFNPSPPHLSRDSVEIFFIPTCIKIIKHGMFAISAESIKSLFHSGFTLWQFFSFIFTIFFEQKN